jgi:hypothetical protein
MMEQFDRSVKQFRAKNPQAIVKKRNQVLQKRESKGRVSEWNCTVAAVDGRKVNGLCQKHVQLNHVLQYVIIFEPTSTEFPPRLGPPANLRTDEPVAKPAQIMPPDLKIAHKADRTATRVFASKATNRDKSRAAHMSPTSSQGW